MKCHTFTTLGQDYSLASSHRLCNFFYISFRTKSLKPTKTINFRKSFAGNLNYFQSFCQRESLRKKYVFQYLFVQNNLHQRIYRAFRLHKICARLLCNLIFISFYIFTFLAYQGSGVTIRKILFWSLLIFSTFNITADRILFWRLWVFFFCFFNF